MSLLPAGTSAEQTDAIVAILGRIHSGGGTSEEDISDQDLHQVIHGVICGGDGGRGGSGGDMSDQSSSTVWCNM